MANAPGNPPTPELFFETVQAYQRTAAIKAAIELDLFSAIAGGTHSPSALAEQCKASPRGMRMLCDYMVILGFLTKHDEFYELTEETGLFLSRSSPAYMGSILRFLLAPQVTAGFDGLTEAIRKGGTVVGEMGSTEPDWPTWVQFAKAMAPLMAGPAEAIADLVGADEGKPWNVLDVAAGHGLFGLAIARRNPQAHVAAVDWSAVLEVAMENAEKAGVAGRYKLIAGDAFEVDFGSGFDIVLLTNLLHHFDVPTCEGLLTKVHAALKPGGRVVTLEFVPGDDRVSPALPAMFALQMLAGTPAGDAYTFAELESMAKNAGFARNEIHDLDASIQSLVISYKD